MSGMSFFATFFEDFGARRQRLRKAIGDRTASFLEFVLLGGVVMGAFAYLIAPPWAAAARWGIVAPIGLIVGLILLDVLRQQAVRARPEDSAPRAFDLSALALAVVAALGGAAAFIHLSSVPDPRDAPPAYEPPPKSTETEITGG
jgi:hypothetical protein